MTVKITVTIPEESREWLRATYRDHTSDSARVANAIRDARSLHQIMDTETVVDLSLDSAIDGLSIEESSILLDKDDIEIVSEVLGDREEVLNTEEEDSDSED